VPVGAVDHESIGSLLVKEHCPLEVKGADRSGNSQRSCFSPGCIWVLPFLEDVLHGDDPGKTPFLVNDRKPLNLMGIHHLKRLLHGDILPGCDRLPGHDRPDLLAPPPAGDPPHIPPADDADYPALFKHRDSSDPLLVHEPFDLCHTGIRRDREDLPLDQFRCLLHEPELGRLLLGTHVPVNDPDPPVPCKGDRHRGFGHGIHGRGDERDVQRDIL